MHFNFESMPRLGMGCWAIGGALYNGDKPVSFGKTDDSESIRTLHAAYEAGIRYFDTANVYGAGHSEKLLGDALSSNDDCLISTKFGMIFDEETKQIKGAGAAPGDVRGLIDDSRRRLKRDKIDMVFLHVNTMEIDEASALFDELEKLRQDNIIASYGWSTDFPERATSMVTRDGFEAVQHSMNLFFDAPSILKVTQENKLMSVIRSPLGMGLLTGKYTPDMAMPEDDIRAHDKSNVWMDYFKDGKPSRELYEKLDALRELLTSDDRTLAQGALCWLLAKGSNIVPIPGARTPKQVQENALAVEKGPLSENVMTEIETLIDRPEEGVARER